MEGEVFTAHVAHVSGLWIPVVKCAGREVWRASQSFKIRDQGPNSAKAVSCLIRDAANEPERFEARLDWAKRFGLCGDADRYAWARSVAADLRAAPRSKGAG